MADGGDRPGPAGRGDAETQSERGGGNGLWSYYRREWFSPAVGLATFLLAELRIGSLAGLLWMAVPRRRLVDQPAQRKRAGLAPGDRAFLLHQATLIWRYFAKLLREEDHWLRRTTGRRSRRRGWPAAPPPTNIGLALLSVMAAVDLDLLPQDQGAGLIGHVLNTVEGLEKWRGHLYNWYDTVSARPMAPRYISTVDSGNLCGSPIALAAGLEEWGEGELAARARARCPAPWNSAPCTTPTAGCFSDRLGGGSGTVADPRPR